MRKFLGIEIIQTSVGIFLHQSTYTQQLLACHLSSTMPPSSIPILPTTRLGLDTATPIVDTQAYQALVSQLLYLTKTRPDICYTTSVLSRYMHSPQQAHWDAALHLLAYLSKTSDLGLWYPKGEGNIIQGFSDADYASNLDDRTSTSAYLFTNGSTPISWSSKKQNFTSRSSCESEYRALAKCTCKAIWLNRLAKELGFYSSQPITLWGDNQSCIKIAKNLVFHDRTKHFEVDWHFTRQKIDDGTIQVNFVKTCSQPPKIFTKALGKTKFESCRKHLNLKRLIEIPS